MPPTRDILLTQRFLPEHGGSIRWMFEVYRRWPRPVEVITHDYYNHPPGTPEFPDAPARPASTTPGVPGDHAAEPNLRMDRRDIFLRDWGIESPGRVLRYLRMARAVRERLRKLQRGERLLVHAVHAVPEVASLVPLKWLYGDRLRVLCYAHGEEVTACSSSRQLTMLMHKAHAIVDVMIANSRYTAGVVGAHIDPAKIHVVNPGVDLASFAGAAEQGARWRAKRGLENRRVVISVGRLDPRKNHAAVIEAMATLASKFPDAVYVLAGEGRAGASLRELAAKRGVADRVIFAGPVDGTEKLGMYGGCDVFAMPAIRDGTDVEGFGMVFLEAGACGKPSLAGREGGQPDAVVDGRTGLIVDGTDQSAVTAGLERLLADASLRQSLGEAAREHAKAFDWPVVVQRTMELTERIG